VARIQSAGILLHRFRDGEPQVLLGHLGGPYWTNRDDGAWSIPKGEIEPGESPEDAARREFGEELGVAVPAGDWTDLGIVRQSKKDVHIWAIEADLDPDTVVPGTFDLQWPPGTGQIEQFAELDRVAWFTKEKAYRAIVTAQAQFLDRLWLMPD